MEIQKFIDKKIEEWKSTWHPVIDPSVESFLRQSLEEAWKSFADLFREKKKSILGNPEWTGTLEDRFYNQALDDLLSSLGMEEKK